MSKINVNTANYLQMEKWIEEGSASINDLIEYGQLRRLYQSEDDNYAMGMLHAMLGLARLMGQVETENAQVDS